MGLRQEFYLNCTQTLVWVKSKQAHDVNVNMMMKVTLYKQDPQKAGDISVWETENKKEMSFQLYVFISIITPTVAKKAKLFAWMSGYLNLRYNVGSRVYIKIVCIMCDVAFLSGHDDQLYNQLANM